MFILGPGILINHHMAHGHCFPNRHPIQGLFDTPPSFTWGTDHSCQLPAPRETCPMRFPMFTAIFSGGRECPCRRNAAEESSFLWCPLQILPHQ